MFSRETPKSKPATRLSPLALLPLLGLLVTRSCDPIVTEFKARPLHVCTNKPITIMWKTRGEAATLESDPVSSLPRKIENNGEVSVILAQTTTFTLRSTLKGDDGSKKVTVEFVPGEGGKTSIEGRALCQLGAFVYTTTIAPEEWDEAIRVDAIKNTSDRTIRVMYGSVAIDLDPGESSESLAGASVGGTWTLSSRLRPFEKCDGGSNDAYKQREHSPYLGLEVSVFCQYP